MREVSKRVDGFHSQRCLVKFRLRWIKWSAFNPAMTHAGVLRQALGVIGAFEKNVSSPEIVPFLTGKVRVSAVGHIVVDGNDEQGGGVRRGKRPRGAFKPVDKTGALRYFVRDLAVGALIFAQEVHGVSGSWELALCVQ